MRRPPTLTNDGNGNRPTRARRAPPRQVPVLVPDVPKAKSLSKYLRRLDTARQYSNFGPLSKELERRAAERLGVDPACVAAVGNATLGLELVLRAVTEGHRRRGYCLVPTLTFPATATAAHRTGLDVLLCGVQGWTLGLSSEMARRVSKQRDLTAVVPVCPYGAGVDYLDWVRFQAESGVPVVLDAAAAWGNLEQKGCVDVPAVYSLHATKSLPAGEGGLVVGPRTLVDVVREASNFGLFGNLCQQSHATNAKLSEYHAAVGLASMDAWVATSSKRRAVSIWYAEELVRYRLPVVRQARPFGEVYTVYPVMLPEGCDAERVQTELLASGIQTRRWYCPPLHQHPGFDDCDQTDCAPTAEALADRLLCLPFHTQLARRDVVYVCQQLKLVLNRWQLRESSSARVPNATGGS